MSGGSDCSDLWIGAAIWTLCVGSLVCVLVGDAAWVASEGVDGVPRPVLYGGSLWSVDGECECLAFVPECRIFWNGPLVNATHVSSLGGVDWSRSLLNWGSSCTDALCGWPKCPDDDDGP